MSYISIGKMAKQLGVTEQTLRNWDKSGKLKPAYISESGYRYYSEEQFKLATGLFFNESDSDKKLEVLIEVVNNHDVLLSELKKQNELILKHLGVGDDIC